MINMEHAILKIQLIKSMSQVPAINDNVILYVRFKMSEIIQCPTDL